MSKRIALLYSVLILFSLLALVAGSALASPSSPVPTPNPNISAIKGGGVEWSHVCPAQSDLNVFVRSENVVQYDCKGTTIYDWSEVCEKKAAIGYTSDDGGGLSVTCGI